MKGKPLPHWRNKIDEIDDEIIRLLKNRMDIGISIGKYKKENNLPTIDYDRRDYILSKYSNALSEYGVQVFNLIHNVSVKIQQDETYYNDIRGYKKIK